MTAKSHIGHVDCPICGHTGAEVKTDKNGRAYIHCKHACSWQGITRTNYQSDQLRARMRPVTVTVTDPVAVKAPDAPPQADTVLAAKVAPVKQDKPVITTPPAKPLWFSPILGGAA